MQHKYKTEEKRRIKDLQFEEKKQHKIDAHKKRYSKIWKVIESQIAIHAGSAKKFGRKTTPYMTNHLKPATAEPSERKSDSFYLSNSNLKSTLNLIIAQEKNQLQFSNRASLEHKERTVNYVVREVLLKFKEDLSDNEVVVEAMCVKLENFFVKMKQSQVRVRFVGLGFALFIDFFQ